MVLNGGARYYLTESEYEGIKQALSVKDRWTIEVQGDLVMRSAIQYICEPSKLENSDRLKRGDWQCEKGHWNDRGAKKCEGGKGHCYF